MINRIRPRVRIKVFTWWYNTPQVYLLLQRFMATSLVFNNELQNEILDKAGLERRMKNQPPHAYLRSFENDTMDKRLRL